MPLSQLLKGITLVTNRGGDLTPRAWRDPTWSPHHPAGTAGLRGLDQATLAVPRGDSGFTSPAGLQSPWGTNRQEAPVVSELSQQQPMRGSSGATLDTGGWLECV